MTHTDKYTRQFFPVARPTRRWAEKTYVDRAPIWCSVDLRDGNQALTTPMSLEEKLEFFRLLEKVGFKEIEVGFPAASETEYTFLRTLIERKMIPDDVTVQVLTQSREHIIRRTFEALAGCPRAIVHLYNSTSLVQREQVFRRRRRRSCRSPLREQSFASSSRPGRIPTADLSIPPNPLPGPSPNLRWRSVRRCWMSGSRHPSGRRSSTCR